MVRILGTLVQSLTDQMNELHPMAVRSTLLPLGRVFGSLASTAKFAASSTVAAVALSTLCVAPASAQGPGWTVNSTVTKLVVTANGGVNVRLSPELTGCNSQSGYGPNYASIYPSHPGINRMKADLLIAYLNGTPVALYLSDNTCTAVELILGGW